MVYLGSLVNNVAKHFQSEFGCASSSIHCVRFSWRAETCNTLPGNAVYILQIDIWFTTPCQGCVTSSFLGNCVFFMIPSKSTSRWCIPWGETGETQAEDPDFIYVNFQMVLTLRISSAKGRHKGSNVQTSYAPKRIFSELLTVPFSKMYYVCGSRTDHSIAIDTINKSRFVTLSCVCGILGKFPLRVSLCVNAASFHGLLVLSVILFYGRACNIRSNSWSGIVFWFESWKVKLLRQMISHRLRKENIYCFVRFFF